MKEQTNKAYTSKDIAKETPKQTWISVEQMLPEKNTDVLIYQTYAKPYITLGWRDTHWEWIQYPTDHNAYNPTSFSSICPGSEYVKYWMPLYEPTR